MSRRRALLILASVSALAAAALAVPSLALAHGLIGKQDLPIPRWLFAWAAAVVLVISFVGLAVLWPKPTLQQPKPGHVVFRVPRILEPLAGIVGVVTTGYMVYAGFAGEQGDPYANLAPIAIFVLFWVGIPFASLAFGDVFRPFNPWRAIARAVAWVGRRVGAKAPEPIAWPARLGRWPAAVGIFLFAWLELVYIDRDDPSKLAVFVLLYAAVQLVGMSLFGIEQWTARGDGFSVYFNLFSRCAGLHWTEFRLERRRFLEGLPGLEILPGTVALVVTMIGSTSFDGLSSGPTWTGHFAGWQNDIHKLGFGLELSGQIVNTIGLIGTILVIFTLYRLGIAGMQSVDRKRPGSQLTGSFAHTLVPIALAYVVAHYFSLLAYNGQAVGYLISDPLGNGSNYFGTANDSINYSWISATSIWYVQVGALVLGHAAGLTLAHDRALATYRKARDATRSQYWMLAVMVGFTSLALWLLSSRA